MSGIKLGPMLGSGMVYSFREGIRIILPGTGDKFGNSTYPTRRNRLGMIEAVRETVIDEIERTRESQPLWANHPGVIVNVREQPEISRGAYAVTVYGEPETIDVCHDCAVVIVNGDDSADPERAERAFCHAESKYGDRLSSLVMACADCDSSEESFHCEYCGEDVWSFRHTFEFMKG